MRVVDLSLGLRRGLRVYPDSVPFELVPVSSYERDGFLVNKMVLDEHSGTHVDAPCHFYPGGSCVSDIPVDQLVGRALVLDVSRGSGEVGVGEVLSLAGELGLSLPRGGYLFLSLGDRVVSVELARYIVGEGLAGLGVDAPSPDREPYPVHRLLLGSGVLIVENLVLPGVVKNKLIDVTVAPLKIEGATGSPARVLALLK